MKILLPFGTRPEIVKLAPVAHELESRGHSVRTIATGQHYDAALSDSFTDSLSLAIDARWELPAGEADRVGALFGRAVHAVGDKPPDLVMLLGDTYTVPAFCFAARRHRVPLAHIEAGLRSFNPTSMEETNRRIAAATAQLHLAPTERAARFLRAEGVEDNRIRVVGNPVLDVLRARGVARGPVDQRRGVLVTAHRATNVDDPDRLAALVATVTDLQARIGPVYFPVHPRTRNRLEAANLLTALEASGASILPPLPYDQLLARLREVRLVVTDSGGLQEEASWLGVPVVVLRRSTPRWEGVEQGAARLCGLDPAAVLDAAAELTGEAEQARIAALRCPYGDGFAARHIADVLDEPGIDRVLALDEPDYVGCATPW